MYQKTMIVITIAFVSCISWLRSGMERYADRKLSLCCQFFVSGFVGLLTYPFMRRGFSPLRKRIASAFSRSHDSPSNDRFSPHAGIPRMENNTLELQLLSESCRALAISNVQTAVPATDSFRVRDLHPIPLFSEQECVSDCSGRAFATKAMLFSLLYARLFYAHKKTSPALLSRRQKKSCILYIFSFGVRKNYLFI